MARQHSSKWQAWQENQEVERSYLQPPAEIRELGKGYGFLHFVPSSILLVERLHFLYLSKQHHQLQSKCSNTWACGGISHWHHYSPHKWDADYLLNDENLIEILLYMYLGCFFICTCSGCSEGSRQNTLQKRECSVMVIKQINKEMPETLRKTFSLTPWIF